MNTISDNELDNINQLAKNKELRILALLSIVYTIIGITIATNILDLRILQEHFPDFTNYYNFFITATQIVLGLIVAVTIFYLGKMHDYKRDFIKHYGKLTETIERYKRKFQSIEKYEDLLKDAEDVLNEYEEDWEYFRNLPKTLISISLLIVFLMSTVLIVIMAFAQTIQNFVFLASSFVFVLSIFILRWDAMEIILFNHDDKFKEIIEIDALLKSKID